MPEIGIADKVTLDQVKSYVDTLETLVGTNSAAAGTSTLFARLAQIAGYTDTLEASAAAIKAKTDTIIASPIKSIQRGTLALASQSAVTTTVTISAVNTNKSMLNYLGSNGAETARVEFVNNTTIRATKTSSYSVTVGYEVIEFY